MRFSIGEFSRMTSLSIKSLRLYHEKELLVPAEVDKFTGYRYYNEANYERAKAIKILKAFDFTLAEIKDMLDECADESELLPQLENKLHEIDSKIRRYREISSAIQELIHYQRESLMMNNKEFEVEEKELETILIAGYRMKGKYQDVGKGISLLYQKMGRQINGKAMALYYDAEYKEDDADFEVCFPIRKGKDEDGISVRELRGGKCVALIHKGPYEILGDSYKRIFAYIHDKGYRPHLPSREVYIKGPGWIFKGNPKNYLTEIQILVEG
ncbi:MAG: MerR family transcriptional regulator [candidate division KSB1 bacterium]|nr:MerR family transcriptional regulator [candidate division KSB1 bacterium]